MSTEKKKLLRIEIQKSFWKKGTYCIRIGDIVGSTEMFNITKKELLKAIEDEIEDLKDFNLRK